MGLILEDIRRRPPEEKIVTFDEMCRLVPRLGAVGIRTWVAQGVCDIVHRGHVGYFREGKNVAPVNGLLVAGIECDESVRLNKGSKRPINSEAERADVLAEFMSIDLVFIYPDCPRYTHPQDYIDRYRALSPDAIVVPSWDPYLPLKEWQAAEAGTRLALVQYQHVNSTTRMLREVGYE